jgi:hypothetical protein
VGKVEDEGTKEQEKDGKPGEQPLDVANVETPSEPNLKSREGGDASETQSGESTAAGQQVTGEQNESDGMAKEHATDGEVTGAGESEGGGLEGTGGFPVTAIVIDGEGEDDQAKAEEGGADGAALDDALVASEVVTATVVAEDQQASEEDTYDEEDEIKREMARIESEIESK